MSLSRKSQKELKRLRSDAQDLWQAQQDVLGRANSVAREAGRQAGKYNREEIAPRVRKSYDKNLRPGVERGVSVGRDMADMVGDRINDVVVPAMGTALGTALSVFDVAKDTRVRAAVKRVSPKKIKQKSGPGAGTYVLVGAGVVALAGVGYAVWQTFRADDELWVADEEPGTEPVPADAPDA